MSRLFAPLVLICGLTTKAVAQRPDSIPFASVSTGSFHSCGLTREGVAYCWGRNDHGQLGDGTTADSPWPIPVAGDIGFTSLSAGAHHTCAVTITRAIYCWGWNATGQLGDGSTVDRARPAPIFGELAFNSVSAGFQYTCAVSALGAAYCWGSNTDGQLGDRSLLDRRTPTPVAGGIVFKSVAAGATHTCGATVAGPAYCWGSNTNGVLGNGTTTNSTAPAPVTGVANFAVVSVGNSASCGVTTTGSSYCWGGNSWGELGDGTTTRRSVPTAVLGGIAFYSVSVGTNYACGLNTIGVAYCWGSNSGGKLGDGTATDRHVPTLLTVGIGARYTSLAAGGHSCAIILYGAPFCWGLNTYGQMGNGRAVNSGYSSPEPVSTPVFASMARGSQSHHACIIRRVGFIAPAGFVLCWGANAAGQLGDGTTSYRPAPLLVSAAVFIQVSVGSEHTCAVRTADGRIWCWGRNNFGQLGTGNTTPYRPWPTPVASNDAFFSVTAGTDHTCAIRASDGAALCWGRNNHGQVGDGSNTDRSIPTAVSTTHRFIALSAGANHACGLRSGNDPWAYCWGRNSNGQLGDGTTTDRNVPRYADAGGLNVFSDIAAGTDHTCALRRTAAGGGVFCWGRNTHGQLGDGTSTDRARPTQSPTRISPFHSLSAGAEHTCGVTSHGAYCWGRNANSQLGDGTSTDRMTPVLVYGSPGFIHSVAGTEHTCAIDTRGRAFCWGGGLGHGASAAPVRVK